MWGVAALLGIVVALLFARRAGLPALRSAVALGVLALALPLGSKLLYLIESAILPLGPLFNPPQSEPVEFFLSGFRNPGGMLLLLALLPVVSIATSLPTLRFADAVAPGVGAAVAMFRVGCFLNGCCFAGPSASFFAVSFPPGSRIYLWQLQHGIIQVGDASSVPVHPLQLYYAGIGAVMFFASIFWRYRDIKEGSAALRCFILFFGGTLLCEFLQVPSLPLNQLACLVGLLALISLALRKRASGAVFREECVLT